MRYLPCSGGGGGGGGGGKGDDDDSKAVGVDGGDSGSGDCISSGI